MYIICTIALIIAGAVVSSFGQTADALKQALIGKTAEFRIEMPATDDGVEILAERAGVIREKSYLKRLRQHGRAYRIGDFANITCVNVKKKRIEICLGGGGYRTIDHFVDTTVLNLNVGKSRREKELERKLETADDTNQREQMRQELNRLKDRRDRENRYRRESAATESRILESAARHRALEAGSRFVIRFARRIESGDLDPEKLIRMLQDYAEITR